MDYAEAKKIVQARKPKGPYMVIEIKYDKSLVLPYEDGLAFMASIANAEQIPNKYGEPERIISIPYQDNFRTSLMSAKEYERYKIAALLGTTPEEIKKYEQPD